MIRHIPFLKIYSGIILLSSFLVFGSVRSVAQINATDSLALVELFNATGGENWTFSFNWKTSAPVQDWYGVQTQEGRVTGLALNGNNLSGSLPNAIGDLTGLRLLFLIGNQLSGSIPETIGNLINMEILFLFANQFSGEIPSTIGNCASLQSISLNNNQLSGKVPDQIGLLNALEILDLSNNLLDGNIPPNVEFLENLTQINLSNNLLDGVIPEELGRCYNLVSINLDDNNFIGTLPTNFQFLTELQGLSARNNGLDGELPDFLGEMSSLQVMYLDNNELNGPIPSSIGNLDQLLFLHLQNNELSGTLPDALGQMDQIRKVYLQDNNFSGSIPTAIGNSSTLELLWLQDNNLSNAIPWELALASNLESLILDNNELDDAMPMSFASALNMKYLSIRNNNIDQLPDLSGITGLTNLLVDGNKLTFEDLEPNANINGNFTYSPQQDVYQLEFHDLSIGDNFSIESQIGGSQNEYTWFKDGFIQVGSNGPQLQLQNLGFGDAGVYWANITSPLLPNLTLKRMDVQINMSSPLPVELTRFHAELDESRVILDWETATEYNNAYFEIERSKDGETFEVVERINGAGTTQEPRTYRAIDTEPYIGVSYYRLHQVDFDGQDSYSDIRVIHHQTTFEILAYPSPVSRGGIMTVLINMKGNLHVRLYDSQSRLLQQRNMWHQNGELLVHLSTAALTPGTYMVMVSNGDETSSQKVVVQ